MSRDCQRKSNIIGQQQSRPNVVRMFDGLSKEVVEKINQVDRDGSTLTTSGIKGFSARIIEKYKTILFMSRICSQIILCRVE